MQTTKTDIAASTMHRAQEGHEDAKLAIIDIMTPLIHSIIRRYTTPSSRSRWYDDLMQQGYLGVLEGIEHYDLVKAHDCQTTTYLTQWVRKMVIEFLAEMDGLTKLPPKALLKLWSDIKDQIDDTEETDEPTITDNGMRITQQAKAELRAFFSFESFEASNIDIADQKQRYEIEHSIDFAGLDRREISVLLGFYYLGWSIEDIAMRYDITTRRVLQIKREALDKCKSEHNRLLYEELYRD